MYSTCLFCNSSLGRNETIEEFPVGRRLAYDSARGRLWVVCRACERWNLTPIEERWEAIESCERAFRATRLRVSTDEIGLARLREGLELVRIGAPQRPEMAAWRYGDQFGRRRRRAIAIGAGAAVVGVGYMIAGPVMGLIGGGGVGMVNVISFVRAAWMRHTVVARIPMAGSTPLVVHRDELVGAALVRDASGSSWSLEVTHRGTGPREVRWWEFDHQRRFTMLTGEVAIRAARLLLPGVNAKGASRNVVGDAVTFLESAPGTAQLFARAAGAASAEQWNTPRTGTTGRTSSMRDRAMRSALKDLPAPVRLALEMSANEESERRALEGELHLLEDEWRLAEEIAGIADSMFLPASVDEELARLKRESPRGS